MSFGVFNGSFRRFTVGFLLVLFVGIAGFVATALYQDATEDAETAVGNINESQ